MAMVDLPNTMVDLPNNMVVLPNTMVDLPNTNGGADLRWPDPPNPPYRGGGGAQYAYIFGGLLLMEHSYYHFGGILTSNITLATLRKSPDPPDTLPPLRPL
jgi:hypothetical protein